MIQEKNHETKQSVPRIHIGTSLLLVVFVILCILILATLTFSSSLHDYQFSQKVATKTTAYYEASGRAQERLLEIDTRLKNDQDLSQICDIVLTKMPSGATVVSFEEPLNKTQVLAVTLEINRSNQYKIVMWKEMSATDWKNQTTLPVLGTNENKSGD